MTGFLPWILGRAVERYDGVGNRPQREGGPGVGVRAVCEEPVRPDVRTEYHLRAWKRSSISEQDGLDRSSGQVELDNLRSQHHAGAQRFCGSGVRVRDADRIGVAALRLEHNVIATLVGYLGEHPLRILPLDHLIPSSDAVQHLHVGYHSLSQVRGREYQ